MKRFIDIPLVPTSSCCFKSRSLYALILVAGTAILRAINVVPADSRVWIALIHIVVMFGFTGRIWFVPRLNWQSVYLFSATRWLHLVPSQNAPIVNSNLQTRPKQTTPKHCLVGVASKQINTNIFVCWYQSYISSICELSLIPSFSKQDSSEAQRYGCCHHIPCYVCKEVSKMHKPKLVSFSIYSQESRWFQYSNFS